MRAHFGGSSRQSLKIARAVLDAAVNGATSDSASNLCSELFFAAKTLDENISLRRAVTDPARDDAAKTVLIQGLFGQSLGPVAIKVVTEVATLRWSAPKDLVIIIESLAIEAEASAANIAGELDRVEEEIFSVSSAIASSYDLRKALTSSSQSAKSGLVLELLGKSATSSTIKLVTNLVNNWRGRNVESAFADYAYALAARRNRLIVLVRVALPMSSAQTQRLVTAMTKQVGQPVRVNVEIDESVIGGVSVKFADELIDGTLSHRIATAARELAGRN